jgi:protein-S-isoprenylcysteine O-methyltransferase Ste14
VQLFGLAASALGYALVGWSMASNRFFAGFVRIQAERGHVVESEGPYRHLRHPGYAGIAGYSLATPLALGTPWALVPGLITTVALVARTALEDRALRHELPGYANYAARVRHRLLPRVW